MYTLCKIKGRSYWQIRYKEGTKRVLRSTGTEDLRLAEEYAQKLAADHWRIRKLGDRPRKEWVTAALEYVQEKQWCKHHLKSLDRFLRGLYLDEITQDLVTRIKQARKTEASNVTVNRTLETLRAIINREDRNGYRVQKLFFDLYDEPERMTFLTREESDRLINELPEHLKPMVRFSLATGLRESNVTRLEWSQVDLSRRTAWIPRDKSKSKEPIQVPLSNEAVVILRAQTGHPKWVFTYKGARVNKINNHAWRKALRRCGLVIRVHDLRHTWASWHVQNGTPLAVLKELGGWADIKMVLRYAHLGSSHIAQWSGNTSGLRSVPKVVTDDDLFVTNTIVSG